MFKLGEYQQLVVTSIQSSGYYLKEPDTTIDDDILLPGNQVSEDTKEGDLLDVFVYRDSKDRLICTIKKPKITLNELALLKVVSISDIGAFLEWGLSRDLFLPHSEQVEPIEKGDEILVRMYIDKTERLCATMKTQKGLKTHPDFKLGEIHSATIYRINPDIGLFVAIDSVYDALVLNQDIFGEYKVGDILELYVSRIREDGRLFMTFKKASYLQIEDDSQYILNELKNYNGFLPFNDSSSPESIRKNFNMSKKSFKRALGRLFKERLITITENGIKLNELD